MQSYILAVVLKFQCQPESFGKLVKIQSPRLLTQGFWFDGHRAGPRKPVLNKYLQVMLMEKVCRPGCVRTALDNQLESPIPKKHIG